MGSESSFSSPQDYELLKDRDSVCILSPGIRADTSWAFDRGWMNEKCKDIKEIIRHNHTAGFICSYSKCLSVSHVPCTVRDSGIIPGSYFHGFFR